MRFLFKFETLKIEPLSHLNDFCVFPRDNIRKTFLVMHSPVFEYLDTLSFALLACIILYINSKQFRCSVFTFVQYISIQISLSMELYINTCSYIHVLC